MNQLVAKIKLLKIRVIRFDQQKMNFSRTHLHENFNQGSISQHTHISETKLNIYSENVLK